MPTAYIALGSNLGDRAGTLLAAVRALNATPGIRVARLSTFHDTTPVGGPPDQPRFLNAAAELATTLAQDALLQALLAIERQFGRVRTEKDGPRTLDLDLILYGETVSTEQDPIVPHPRMHERRFVLAPLAEIAPTAVHPILGTTVAELLAALPTPTESPEAIASETRVGGPRRQESLANERLRAPAERVLVTGSTSGIGRAIALAFAAGGAQVVVHGYRSADRASAVMAEVEGAGGTGSAVRADLRDVGQCGRLVEESWGVWGGLDVAVLNAGADVLTGPAAGWSFARKLDALLAVDVTATMTLARDLGERMRRQGHGVILTMGWDQAETGMEGDSGQLFAAVKGAVMAFTRSLAVSLAPTVRVNCLAPGWVRTAWGASASAVWQQRVLRETPLQRWGTAEDIAAAAVWLASPGAAFVTGQVVRVNGGAVR